MTLSESLQYALASGMVEELIPKLSYSTLLLDEAALEIIHWSILKSDFINKYGVKSIRNFDTLTKISSSTTKIVILLAGEPVISCSSNFFLTFQTLFDSKFSEDFEELTVFFAYSLKTMQIAHEMDRNNNQSLPRFNSDLELVHFWESKIANYLQIDKVRVKLIQLLFGFSQLTEKVIFMPGLLKPVIFENDFDKLTHNFSSSLALKSQSYLRIRIIVDHLNNLMENLKLREDVFTMGSICEFVGQELINSESSKNRQRSAKFSGRASLILCDRLTDVYSISNSILNKHFMDTLFEHFPLLGEDTGSGDFAIESDICVGLGELSVCKNSKLLPKGHLCPPNRSTNMFHEIIHTKSVKDSLSKICCRLNEIGSKLDTDYEKISEKKIIKFNAAASREFIKEQISHFVEFTNGKLPAELFRSDLDVLIFALCALQTEESKSNSIKAIISYRVQFHKSIMAVASAPHEQEEILIEYLLNYQCEELSLDELYQDLIASTNLITRKYNLKLSTYDLIEKIIFSKLQAVKNLSKGSKFFKHLIPDDASMNENNLHCIAKYLTNILQKLREYRNKLVDFGDVIPDEGLPLPVPMVLKLVMSLCRDCKLVNTNNSFTSLDAYPDFKNKSSGVKDLLKSGLGFLMSLPKSSMVSNNTIIVAVIGSLNYTEISSFINYIKSQNLTQTIILAGVGVSPRSGLCEIVDYFKID